MTGWEWWAGDLEEDGYGIESGCKSREEIIRKASQWMRPGDQFAIIEARSSTDRRYEGADLVPFLRTRNEEIVTVGPVAVGGAKA